MNKKEVFAVFDIGKTNKKILLFDKYMKVVFQQEEKFPVIADEDDEECDDILLIENWIRTSLTNLLAGSDFDVKAVNFSTYGASLAFLDESGNRLTPIYNYLKDVDESIQTRLFEKYGGKAEFCRQTASPALGKLLNSGIQILWLRNERPEIFQQVKHILHFPQYLSYLLTGKISAESTSIGCHTFLWNFDTKNYHRWLDEAGIQLTSPEPNSFAQKVTIAGSALNVGIGIHDSSASLVPYLKASKTPFLLISTGTWCVNMNPFNASPLTAHQLKNDCLCYLSAEQKPVKSSRLFMGHIHDVNVLRLSSYFGVNSDQYKKLAINEKLLTNYLNTSVESVFFSDNTSANYIDETVDLSMFSDFSEAYHRLMFDLTKLNVKSIDLITEPNDGVARIYIAGGFARNEIFVRLIASLFSEKEVFTSEVDNSSALGAAMVLDDLFESDYEIDLGLKKWLPL